MNEPADNLRIAIIGSGSGAFAAAIKAADEGAVVTLIERDPVIGGTCVNVGCVPSKIMLRSAQLAQYQRRHPFDGLGVQEPRIDRRALLAQQVARVEQLRQTKYQDILDSNNAISLIKGSASFVDAQTLRIERSDGTKQSLTADRILIATGAAPTLPDIPGLNQVPYWRSTQALSAEVIPDQLLIIGSSVVAAELAQAYRRLGSGVTVLARTRLLSREDAELGDGLTAAFVREGIRVVTGAMVSEVSHDGTTFFVNSNLGSFTGDALLVAVGRSANTSGLNLDAAGVRVSNVGDVVVDDLMQTTQQGIFAAGDCTTQPQYVYVAAAAGMRAAINMTGGEAKLDLSTMPAVIFTSPQVATVGYTEAQAREANIAADSRTLALEHVPRALANFETDGFVKLVIDASDGRLIGAQILAAEAGEVIQAAALAIRNKMTVEQLGDQLFPYLTMVESLKLCAQTFFKDVKELSCCAG